MKLKVFALPAAGDDLAEDSVNHFLARHRIAQVDRQLVQAGAGSYWTVCIGYWESTSEPPSRARKTRIDYREVLNDTRFREYAALREWRKAVAESEGVPVFAIFSNEQLANIVQLETATLAAMATIDGIGSSKLAQYAQAVLAALADHRDTNGHTDA